MAPRKRGGRWAFFAHMPQLKLAFPPISKKKVYKQINNLVNFPHYSYTAVFLGGMNSASETGPSLGRKQAPDIYR